MLTNGKNFAIFDHELGLMTDLNLFWKEPWQINALHGARPPQEHVYFGHLRGRKAYELDQLSTRLAALTNERINEYICALPPSWAAEAEICTKAGTFIMALRDNLVPAGTELKRALSWARQHACRTAISYCATSTTLGRVSSWTLVWFWWRNEARILVLSSRLHMGDWRRHFLRSILRCFEPECGAFKRRSISFRLVILVHQPL